MTRWDSDNLDAAHTQRELDQEWGMEAGYCEAYPQDAAARIDQLERELAAEKALADRLIVAGANALQNYTMFIKKFSDDWDDACAAYRKARGL